MKRNVFFPQVPSVNVTISVSMNGTDIGNGSLSNGTASQDNSSSLANSTVEAANATTEATVVANKNETSPPGTALSVNTTEANGSVAVDIAASNDTSNGTATVYASPNATTTMATSNSTLSNGTINGNETMANGTALSNKTAGGNDSMAAAMDKPKVICCGLFFG